MTVDQFEDLPWTGVIRCTECGLEGTLNTSDPNQEHLWFDCPECGECTEHEKVIMSDTTTAGTGGEADDNV